MACAEKTALWGFAANELPADVRARIEEHLAGCESCRAELAQVRATREVLSFAAPLSPQVDWRKADEKVHGAVEKRFLRAERGWGWLWAGLAGAGALAVVLAVLALGRRPQAIDPAQLALLDALPTPSAVEAAEGALVAMGGAEHLLKPGEDLKSGAQVKTTASGKAIVKLPEGSRLRVASASDLVLQKAAKDEVGLWLKGGRVAVTATHAARKAFLVHADGATVRVVGTAFSVGLSEGSIDVAVAEGRVLVELADGQVKPVSAGERLAMDRARPLELEALKPVSLAPVDRVELGELGVQVPVAEVAEAKPAPRPAARPVVAAAPVPTPAPQPVAVPAAKPVNEWASAPAGQPGEPSDAWRKRPRAAQPVQSISGQDQMLNAYELGSKDGHCAKDLDKWETLAEDGPEDGEDVATKARAACLVARCYKGLGKGALADKFYRKCLSLQPDGPFAREARQNLPP